MKFKPLFLIPFLSFTFLLLSFIDQEEVGIDDGEFVVVLDAGHGGHDPGNLGNGYLEKNIALNIVLRIGKILEQDPSIKVIYTRKDDSFVDLYVRGEIANKADADLFVSVHCDSHSSDAHGVGTFVLGLHANKQNFEIAKKENSVIYLEDNYEKRYADYDINSPESIIGLTIMQEEFLDQSIALAKSIQDNLSMKLKRHDRQVKQAGFIVLHQTFMPSVLIEAGFLTNNDEGAYLNSSKGQLEMGTAIADAIKTYRFGVQPSLVKSNEPLVPIAQNVEKKNKTAQADKATKMKSSKVPADKEIAAVENKAISEVNQTTTAPGATEPTKDLSSNDIKLVKEEIKEPVKPVIDSSKEAVAESKKAVIKESETEKGTTQEEKEGLTDKIHANIIYKVQILASVQDLALRANNFRGLDDLSRETYKNMYRYMYGNVKTFDEAKLLKFNADMKGYTTSFIVAYKDGQRITVPEAGKYVSD